MRESLFNFGTYRFSVLGKYEKPNYVECIMLMIRISIQIVVLNWLPKEGIVGWLYDGLAADKDFLSIFY